MTSLIPGYIFFKVGPFAIRRGTINPQFICYMWNDYSILESDKHQVFVGNGSLLFGWVRGVSGRYVFVVCWIGKTLVGYERLMRRIDG